MKIFKTELLKEAVESVVARTLARRASSLTAESQRWLSDELPQLVIMAYATYRAFLTQDELNLVRSGVADE